MGMRRKVWVFVAMMLACSRQNGSSGFIQKKMGRKPPFYFGHGLCFMKGLDVGE